MNALRSLLGDGTGEISSMRMALLVWTIGPFLMWAWTSWQAKALQPIPDSVLLALGAVLSGKCLQNVTEGSTEPATPPQPSPAEPLRHDPDAPPRQPASVRVS